ncbi:transposase [Streptomyces olivochromogenes]|nr:transposase [Streptomyces olivochromogenes]
MPRPADGHPRIRPDHLSGDNAHSSRRNRRYLRRRQIKHTVPERRDQQAHRRGSDAGRLTGFDPARHAHRNEIERLIHRLKTYLALATRFDNTVSARSSTAATSSTDASLKPASP